MEGHVELDRWQEDVAGFVEAHLLRPPRRVLDVGCGDGWLSHRLAGSGYRVTGIDPEAPEGQLFERVSLEGFGDPGPFDAVVAVLSLHHIPDLRGALEKIAGLLGEGGTLVAVEFAWDRFDDATARWALERLPSELDEENWLHQRCEELRERVREGRRLEAAEHVRRWAAEEGLHPSSELLGQLRGRFSEQSFSWSPYLYPDLAGISEAEERSAIESERIQATGFRFVGTRT